MRLGIIKKIFFKTRNEKLIEDIKKQKRLLKQSIIHEENYFLSRFYSLKLERFRDYILYKYGCEIHPEAIIKNAIFRHPVGIVMGGGYYNRG